MTPLLTPEQRRAITDRIAQEHRTAALRKIASGYAPRPRHFIARFLRWLVGAE